MRPSASHWGSRPGTKTLIGMGQKYPRAQQAHHRRNCLDHCRTSLAPPAHEERTTAALHSQKNPDAKAAIRREVMICCNRCLKAGQLSTVERREDATDRSPRRGSPHFRRVPVAISSRFDAEVGRIVGISDAKAASKWARVR
jgi:hypothetical protein